jgi:hypothetical protein
MKNSLITVFCFVILVSGAYCESPDVLTIPPDLKVPKVTTGNPTPGKRVLQALPQYEGSAVRHALYLPTDWEEGKTYPVLVEYTGNNGTVKGGKACQGYGISGGKGFLWICLPYVSKDRKNDMDWWWGDPDLTAAYAMVAITDVCERWGGDPKAVILTGYSRGAIACNYIGLRNDDIARLWLAMVPASHYDNRRWGMSPAEFQRGPQRLKRLGNTPQYVCGEHHLAMKHNDPKLLKMVHDRRFDTFETAKRELGLIPMTQQEGIREFIIKNHPAANITFADFPWVNHTGDWILRDTPERLKLRAWVQNVLVATRIDKQNKKLKPTGNPAP